MKLTLILATLILAQGAFSTEAGAQSQKAKRTKAEMITRTEALIEKVKEAREDLEREDVVNACGRIREIFALYPDHLKSLGINLDERRKVLKATYTSLAELEFFDNTSLLCSRGKDAEYVNAKELRRELKGVLKSLKKQRRIIRRDDADSENSFYYEYGKERRIIRRGGAPNANRFYYEYEYKN